VKNPTAPQHSNYVCGWVGASSGKNGSKKKAAKREEDIQKTLNRKTGTLFYRRSKQDGKSRQERTRQPPQQLQVKLPMKVLGLSLNREVKTKN
jgi:hypothetical protein